MFMKSFNFCAGTCKVLMHGEGVSTSVTFNYVRATMFYKESDFFNEIGLYEKESILDSDGNMCPYVFRIVRNSLLEGVQGGRLKHEDPLYFCVWTPDECLEVCAFEYPTFG